MKKIIRNKCVICENTKFCTLKNVKNFPVYMGASKKDEEYYFNDLKFVSCNNCNTIQLRELIPLEILYKDNHNTEVIGQLWKEHNKRFSEFISSNKPNKIVEIGDPSLKFFNMLKNNDWLKKWTIIEPNHLYTDYNEKLKIIKFFFDTLEISEEILDADAYILSHVFEHFYEPNQIMKKIDSFTKESTMLFLSVPDMRFILNNKLLPPASLCFEHTFFADLNNIEFLLNKNNYSIEKVEYFENHSLFIKAIKRYHLPRSSLKSKNINLDFKKIIKKYEDIVKKTEKIDKLYIYGAHFQTQFFIKLGLDENKIINILDNSSIKQNNFLYGTNLLIKKPDFIKDKGKIKILCYMGSYTEEIKEQLIKINSQVEFI